MEEFRVTSCNATPVGIALVQVAKLDAEDCGLDSVKTRVSSLDIMVIFDLGAPATPTSDIFRHFVVIGGHTAAISPCTQVLAGIEGPSASITKRTNSLPLELGTLGLSTVLNNIEVMLLRDCHNSIHISWVTVQMHRTDRLCPTGDLGLDLVAIDCFQVRVDVTENKVRAIVADTKARSYEGVSLSDDFIAWTNSKCFEGKNQSISP